MKSIETMQAEILSTNNTFSFVHNIKTVQLFIMNMIVLYLQMNSETDRAAIQNKIYSLCIAAKFNYKSYLKRYVIHTYFNKMSSDYTLHIIIKYFDAINFFDVHSTNKKLLRYIKYKLENKKEKNLIVYMNEKNKIMHISL